MSLHASLQVSLSRGVSSSYNVHILRLRLIKIGGWARERTLSLFLRLAGRHRGQPLWVLLADCFKPNE
jgi:hypothetical protein